jgi:hypothetical protein
MGATDMNHWTDLGLRHTSPMSARSKVTEIAGPLRPFVDERVAKLDSPYLGITIDGSVRQGLYQLEPTGVPLAPLVEAALTFLGALTSQQRARCVQPLASQDWRTWINVHMNFFRHGVMLEDLDDAGRQLGLDLLRETLSARGFGQARDIMRLNELIGDVTGRPDEYGEWPYFVTVFGEPGADEPWGWQLDGHHLVVNCVVVGDQLVLTPTFMGAEPCHVHEGRYAGTQVFTAEERAGLDVIRSLGEAERATAVLRSSIHPDDLPPELQHPFDGRMQAGAFHDNATIPNEGVAAADLSDAQRRLLLNLVATYVGWTRDGHSEVKMDEVVRHLDETHFAWMGATGDEGPFYYRVQSPVVLIEFDHHPGVVFDNKVPSRNHVHSLVRTPNGGDYGADLLRQHHDRYDHADGEHRHRH